MKIARVRELKKHRPDMSYREIGKHLGYSKSTVERIVNEIKAEQGATKMKSILQIPVELSMRHNFARLADREGKNIPKYVRELIAAELCRQS